MKKLVEVTEVAGEGLEALLGENVTIFCMNYIYAGTLVGVNSSFIKLENASVVYDTGAFSKKDWATAEELPGAWYVQNSSIESFGLLKG